MIFDDVVTRESVTTPEQITKTTAAWELADNLGQAGGRKWHIGTRYSFADTYQSILERGSVIPRIYPATDDGTMDGRPVLWTPDIWEQKKRDQGEATVACQLLQNPIAGQQAMFKAEWLRYYEVRPATLNIYIMIDPARSTKPDSANTAMAVIGMDGARNKYLLDGYRHRMALSERWQRMRDLRTHWLSQPGVQQVYVGYEKFGAQSDMDYFVERMQTEKCSFEIIELEWPRDRAVKSKEDRVQRLEPDFKNGRFWLPTRAHGPTKNQKRMTESGSGYRCAKQIRRKDNDGNIYDLVTDFTFEDLDVWKRACVLAVRVYQVLRESREFALRDQMQRAAVSIASNIAEGHERSRKDFSRFLTIARGSSAELRTQTYIAARIGVFDKTVMTELVNETREISRMLYALTKALKTPPKPSSTEN